MIKYSSPMDLFTIYLPYKYVIYVYQDVYQVIQFVTF